ncbi:MAG: FAD-dependent oxidoreductase [Candidatus Campbellbacteria bacterium]|nr:FAD-dependent oxidoreductase [Candidatus Campbellbacteria bacterium]
MGNQKKKIYDMIVVGGGSGGIAGAIRAGQLGKNVLLVESAILGGTCVNLGCVPKKLLFSAADFMSSVKNAEEFFSVEEIIFRQEIFKSKSRNYIGRLGNDVYPQKLNEAGVEVVESRAQSIRLLANRNGVEVTTDTQKNFHGKKVLIATGSKPYVPKIKGAELGITSDDFWFLEKLPESVAIVGGGYIATEFANILHRLGVKVTMLIRGENILRGFDEDIVRFVSEEMSSSGITIVNKANIKSLERTNGKISIWNGPTPLNGFETVIWATGRIPNANFEGIKLPLDDKGKILVGKGNQKVLGSERVYAVGDVCNRGMDLTPSAIHDARLLMELLFGKKKLPPTDAFSSCSSSVPTVVFSTPTICAVGITEKEARERYGEAVNVVKVEFNSLDGALGEKKVRNTYKAVIVDEEGSPENPGSHIIVGIHLAGGKYVAEVAQLIPLLLEKKLQDIKPALDHLVHPTATEELAGMIVRYIYEKLPAKVC